MRNTACIAGLLLALLMLGASGCEKIHHDASEEEPADALFQEGALEMPVQAQALAVATVVINDAPFSVEIAKTDSEKARGLSGRESLPENAGMWFVFDRPVQESFWMQGMEIPLDIIFVGEDMKVVHLFENAAPDSTELITSPVPYMYVLEINAGKSSAHGIKKDDEVKKLVGGETAQ